MAVIGVTDYFSIDGYKQVLGYRREGRLSNIACVLPNIELRLDTFVVDQKARDINFHVIFSDELHPEDIEKEFLEALRVKVSGSVAGIGGVRQLTERTLVQLGQEIKKHHAPFQKDSDLVAALKNITVSLDQVQELLRKDIFQNRFLLVLAGSEWGDIDWNQAYLTKKNFLQGAHVLDAASPKTIAWALGKGGLSSEQFIKEFGRLKPCIHGSDAHSLDRIAKPDAGRFCWIKADPSFEGLRQIVFEPAERVFIGQDRPTLKRDHQVISSVQIKDSNGWFPDVSVPLNPDLVAILGGRGSGKSALAEIIAFAGRAQTFHPKRTEKIEDSFLFKASKRSPTNPTPVTGTTITLQWADGTNETATINSSLMHDGKEEKVKYLPQKFVEFLCAPENTQHIEQEIERVIFQRLDKTRRLGASDFRELRDASTRSIGLRRRKLAETIGSLNRTIADLTGRIGQRDAKVRQYQMKTAERDRMEKNKPILPSENQEEIRRLDALEDDKRKIEQAIVERSKQMNALQSIETKIQIFREEINTFNYEITGLLAVSGLSAESPDFLVVLPVRSHAVIARRHGELDSELQELRDGATQPSLSGIAAELRTIKAHSQLARESREAFEKFQKDYTEVVETVRSLEAEIIEIDDTLVPRLQEEEKKRIDKYLEIFALLDEEKGTLEQLYQPLQTALLAGTETDQKLNFVARFSLDTSQLADRGLEIIDRTRKGKYREERALEAGLKQFWASLENEGFEREVIRQKVLDLRKSFQRDEDGNPLQITEQLRKGKSLQDFDNWFFSADFFSVVYSMRFDGKDLQLLSPGQKGIVLLLVYLEVDQNDSRPLLIDQPEDNLDNLSVL